MKFYPLVALCVFILFGSVVFGQRSGNAQDYYDRGIKRYQSGDLEGAIENFTNAIELSTRLGKPPKTGTGLFPQYDDDSAQSDRIRVVDPLAARAYCNRVLARYRQ